MTKNDSDARIDRVYRYGCHHPEPRGLAEQLLGQAWLYGDELRRIHNDHKREVRSLRAAKDDDVAHVVAHHYDRLNERTRAARDARRRGHLLDAGTYWLVEDEIQRASKAMKLDPIRRKPFDGTGRIGAAIQSVEQFPADAWRHKRVSLSAPDARGRAVLTIHVGDLKTGAVLTWPILLHRPLPRGATVKQVAVQRVRVGHRFRWQALVTINFVPEPRAIPASGVVGIDVGWRFDKPAPRDSGPVPAPRLLDKTLRVATIDGGEDRRALHVDTLTAFAYSDGVRAIRDRVFDQAKAHVREVGLPGADHAHLWKDKERMRRLADRTSSLGPSWWREVDRHLEDIECGVRARAVRRRLETYRLFAKDLAARYRVAVLEDMPMQDWVGESDTHARERRRSVAALALLQSVIVEAFGPERVHWEPSMNTSRTCGDCGVVREASVGPGARWTCEGCGADHHQDENAARVLRLLGERWIDAGNPPRARARKASRRKEKEDARGIATGDELRMTVTAREEAAE